MIILFFSNLNGRDCNVKKGEELDALLTEAKALLEIYAAGQDFEMQILH